MTDTDKLASAIAQGQAQFNSILDLLEAFGGWQAAAEAEGWTGPHEDKFGVTYYQNEDGSTWACKTWERLCSDQDIDPTEYEGSDEARQAIEEDALSVQVRTGWHQPGTTREQTPEEFEILLCTGGPACRIVGTLDEYAHPETARLEVQDWFTPWTAMRPEVSPGNYDSEPFLLAYARVFYFGE